MEAEGWKVKSSNLDLMLSFGDRCQSKLELTFYMSLWVCMLGYVLASSKKVKKWYQARKFISSIVNKEKFVKQDG